MSEALSADAGAPMSATYSMIKTTAEAWALARGTRARRASEKRPSANKPTCSPEMASR